MTELTEPLQPTVSTAVDQFHLVSEVDGHLGNVVRQTDHEGTHFQLNLHPGLWTEEHLRALGEHLLAIVGRAPRQ